MKDALLTNKVAAGVIGAALLAMVAGSLADMLYAPKTIAEDAYPIAVAESAGASTTEAAEPAGPEPVSPLLASADSAKGLKLFKKCSACHTYEKGGSHKLGPNLWNIVDRAQGGVAEFGGYSKAMQAAGGAWTYEDLNAFLAKPKDYLKGTAMNFGGFKKPQDRADIIAFLREQADAPVALP
ncbi:MAG: cytochrome c family protein [Alphaproteobacteria bacterium]|nr:cytochrome c family protein [Alphaproteobacteria bacterium]